MDILSYFVENAVTVTLQGPDGVLGTCLYVIRDFSYEKNTLSLESKSNGDNIPPLRKTIPLSGRGGPRRLFLHNGLEESKLLSTLYRDARDGEGALVVSLPVGSSSPNSHIGYFFEETSSGFLFVPYRPIEEGLNIAYYLSGKFSERFDLATVLSVLDAIDISEGSARETCGLPQKFTMQLCQNAQVDTVINMPKSFKEYYSEVLLKEKA